jgi:hypothetical protein
MTGKTVNPEIQNVGLGEGTSHLKMAGGTYIYIEP